MATPDYVICVTCETPCYVFEWRDEKVVEAICEICGEDDPTEFMTEADIEELSLRFDDKVKLHHERRHKH